MRRCFAIPVAAAAMMLTLAGPAGRVRAAEEWRDEPYPVDLRVGETFRVCDTGLILCPAIAPLCDDPKVAVPVDTPEGLGFRGVGPGTTLCSALPAGGIAGRPVFRITVHAPEQDR
jgi:hypothetical protein